MTEITQETTNRVYNHFLHMYYTSAIKQFVFCQDCQDHLLFYVDDLNEIQESISRITELCGHKVADLKVSDEPHSWDVGETELTLNSFSTSGGEDERLGKIRVEFDFIDGHSFDTLLKDLFALETKANKL